MWSSRTILIIDRLSNRVRPSPSSPSHYPPQYHPWPPPPPLPPSSLAGSFRSRRRRHAPPMPVPPAARPPESSAVGLPRPELPPSARPVRLPPSPSAAWRRNSPAIDSFPGPSSLRRLPPAPKRASLLWYAPDFFLVPKMKSFLVFYGLNVWRWCLLVQMCNHMLVNCHFSILYL